MFRIHISDHTQHRHFVLSGSHHALTDFMAQADGEGIHVHISPVMEQELLPHLIVPEAGDLVERPSDTRAPWLVWNRLDFMEIQQAAQSQGALTVLSGKLSSAALFNALQTADLVLSAGSPNTYAATLKRNIERGEQIHLEEDRIIRIRRGVVRCTSFHPDGSEVLIGLYGEGDVLMAHASYDCHNHSCHVEMRAHTSLVITIEPWQNACTSADFYEKLKQRICQMELWSSMQSRPNAEDRLLGLLQVIGGRFSRTTENGIVLDIKLTHEQLASAVGATRTTVTRLLGQLKKKGIIHTTRTPMGEFFVLVDKLEQCVH